MSTPSLSVTINPANIRVTAQTPTAEVGFGGPVVRDAVERDPYTGDYSVTPSEDAVTLATKGLRMTDNVTINPIPPNYGRITWDGATLTVS